MHGLPPVGQLPPAQPHIDAEELAVIRQVQSQVDAIAAANRGSGIT